MIKDSEGNEIGSFTRGIWRANYAYSPGKAGLYNYHGEGRITQGTGILQSATGSITESGPYIFWILPDGSVEGKYVASASASISVPQ